MTMHKGGFTMNRNPKKRSKAFYAIVISLLILAIPTSFILYTGITSLMGRGKPIVGKRFANDQDPKITEASLNTVVTSLKSLEGVSNVDYNLQTGTLRIYILNEDANKDSLGKKLKEAFDVVVSELSVETYFTQSGVKKQYDLEIHGFNQLKPTDETIESYVYGIYVKNASMTEPYYQTLTTPLSQEMVDFFIEEEEYNSRPKEEAPSIEPSEDDEDATPGEGE